MQTRTEEKKPGNGEKPYTDEFRRSVVTHWLDSGKSARKVAEEFGIKQWNLRDWRFKYAPAPKSPEDPHPETADGLRAENVRLRRELARVTSQREILKKNFRHCLGSVESRYEQVQELSGEHGVADLCQLLCVARSGYYAWCSRAQSQQEAMNEELSMMIETIFREHKGRYGSPRVTNALRRKGQKCNHKRVERIMRESACGHDPSVDSSQGPPTASIRIRSHPTTFRIER